MNKKNSHTKKLNHIWSFLIIILLLTLAAGCVIITQGTADGKGSYSDELFISHESGFYSHSVKIKALFPEHSTLYYTTDGSIPSTFSETSHIYDGPIRLSCHLKEQTTHLRFCLFYDDGTASKVYDYSYILGYLVKYRYGKDVYVVSISGDPEELFGYEDGIFVAGKLRDDYLAQHPEITEAYNMDPAGYNQRGREAERSVNLQMFDAKGDLLLSQNCGLRIFGNFSRGKDQKSFQLFARKTYDDFGKFNLSMFPELKRVDGSILDEHNRLVFRNSGNDYGQAFLRDTLIQKLSSDYGFPMTSKEAPACVYINGSYMGFYWVKEPFSDQLANELYGIDTDMGDGTISRVSINEFYQTATDPAEELAEDYQNLYDTYAHADLTDDSTYQAFCRRVDVENYLQYYAIELLIANKDWPYNNVRAYRYISPSDTYAESGLLDGRYRYLLFDTDYGFGLSDDVPGYSVEEDNIAVLLNNEQSPVFSRLMEREDCRNYFVTVMCDLMNSSFEPGHINEQITALCALRDEELSQYAKLEDTSFTAESIASATDEIRNFVNVRSEYMHSFLGGDYAMFYPYVLSVAQTEHVSVAVNTTGYQESSFAGVYYADCPLEITFTADAGHKLQQILIDGADLTTLFPDAASYEGNSAVLRINSDQLKSYLGITEPGAEYTRQLCVSTMAGDFSDCSIPVISELQIKGSEDRITLFNPYDHAISLEGYTLGLASSDETFVLPAQSLAPGSSVSFYGSKHKFSLYGGSSALPFSLVKGNTLQLTDSSGSVTDEILLPDLTSEESVYRRDFYTGQFTEIR